MAIASRIRRQQARCCPGRSSNSAAGPAVGAAVAAWRARAHLILGVAVLRVLGLGLPRLQVRLQRHHRLLGLRPDRPEHDAVASAAAAKQQRATQKPTAS